MSYEPIMPRARLGFMIPSSNRMAEPDFQRFAPEGVVPHFMRIRMSGKHKAEQEELIRRIEEAATILGDSKCDAIVLQCTGTSMSAGYGGEREMIAAIERAAGCPGSVTATCLMAALETLGARRLVFISENDEAGYAEKRQFLVDAGYDILGGKGAALVSDQSCITPPAFWADLAREFATPDADAYFLSCANIRAIDTIDELEAELGRPVLTSNQVALWYALRTAGIGDEIAGLGRLGRLPAAASVTA